MGSLAYAFVAENWAALARLAGTNVFAGKQWLLPGAASRASDVAVAQRLLDDQERLLGAPGAANAAREATAIRTRQRLREREATRIAEALK